MKNARMSGPPVGDTLIDFLRRVVERYGPRDALLFKPAFRYQRWSYSRLWSESGQVATLLRCRGLTKGDRAILWGPNSPHWVLIFFGCIRAGVILVPLDLRSAPDYVAKVVSRTDPKLAFTSRSTPKGEVDLGSPEITFEELEVAIQGLPQPEDVDTKPDDLAEIMFTSGTTGDPKGVMLTHRNLTANIEGVSQYISCNPSSRFLSILPLSHMYEQMGGLFIVLYHGASVTYATSRQPTVLARTMRERRITIMLLVPQALEMLMNGIEGEVKRQGKEAIWNRLLRIAGSTPFPLRRLLFRRVHKQFGGKLDFIVSGGAALDQDLGRKWELVGVKIVQGYGTTEASPVISNHSLRDRRLDSTGRPLPNVEVRISREGEILVRGDNVTPGYWRAPGETAAAFDEDWYKTGDLGFLDDEGFLHIHGRKKDVIVLSSGLNIFPEDMEAVLAKHPNVAGAAVVGLMRGSSVEVHAALILHNADAAQEVIAWTNAQLAEQQRIRGFTVWVDEDFPRTHTLKVKKGVVIDTILGKVPPDSPAVSPGGGNPPGGARRLLHIIGDVSRRGVGEVRDDATLGDDMDIDSLGRVELLSAIEAELGVYMDESQLSPEMTVRQLEDLVEEGSRNQPMMRFPGWGMQWWCRILRGFLQRAVVFPLVSLAYGLKVVGRENLEGITGPVLLASNHNLGLDNPLIIKAVPVKWRRRMAVAGAADLWKNPVWSIMNPLLANAFPFAKEGSIRPSLENMGKIMDNGWSVLIYPEGELTVGGPIKPFMNGTGLVAVEERIPVVPLRLCIHQQGSPARFPILRRGKVEIRFGEPLTFSPVTDYQDATSAIEEAVRSL